MENSKGKVISSKFQGRDYLVRFTFKNIELLTYSSQKLTKDEVDTFRSYKISSIMHLESLQVTELCSERLILMPFTISICENILQNNYTELEQLNLVRGKGWPTTQM